MAESGDAGSVMRDAFLAKLAGHDGNFISARHTNDLDFRNTRAPQLRPGRAQHGVHITRVVARRHDGEGPAGRLNLFLLILAEHRLEFNHDPAGIDTRFAGGRI